MNKKIILILAILLIPNIVSISLEEIKNNLFIEQMQQEGDLLEFNESQNYSNYSNSTIQPITQMDTFKDATLWIIVGMFFILLLLIIFWILYSNSGGSRKL